MSLSEVFGSQYEALGGVKSIFAEATLLRQQKSTYLSNNSVVIKTRCRYVKLNITAILWNQNHPRTHLTAHLKKKNKIVFSLLWSMSIQK